MAILDVNWGNFRIVYRFLMKIIDFGRFFIENHDKKYFTQFGTHTGPIQRLVNKANCLKSNFDCFQSILDFGMVSNENCQTQW